MANEASYEDAQDAARKWSAAVLQCRTLGHAWRQTNATHVVTLNYWKVSYHCVRGCGVTRYEEWNSRGVVIGRSGLTYPRDPDTGEPLYLSDIGRILGEAKGALRLENATRGPNDRRTGRVRDEDQPRRASSRRELGLE